MPGSPPPPPQRITTTTTTKQTPHAQIMPASQPPAKQNPHAQIIIICFVFWFSKNLPGACGSHGRPGCCRDTSRQEAAATTSRQEAEDRAAASPPGSFRQSTKPGSFVLWPVRRSNSLGRSGCLWCLHPPVWASRHPSRQADPAAKRLPSLQIFSERLPHLRVRRLAEPATASQQHQEPASRRLLSLQVFRARLPSLQGPDSQHRGDGRDGVS